MHAASYTGSVTRAHRLMTLMVGAIGTKFSPTIHPSPFSNRRVVPNLDGHVSKFCWTYDWRPMQASTSGSHSNATKKYRVAHAASQSHYACTSIVQHAQLKAFGSEGVASVPHPRHALPPARSYMLDRSRLRQSRHRNSGELGTTGNCKMPCSSSA